MTRERDVAAACLRWLNSLPGARFRRQRGDESNAGEPDVYGTAPAFGGRLLLIEFKRPGMKSRPLQVAVQRKWTRAGALVLADVSSLDDLKARLTSFFSS